MGEWQSAFIFGLGLLAFVIGISSIITGFITPATDNVMQKRVEYGFFGVSGIVVSLVFVYILA
ncbi:MAG: hypothetical protein GJ680_13495 [Alteromonadaceae bacterium]|nr:hypothetical protein [Alteromonadaceae bacterium]